MKKIYVVGSINTDLVINTPYMPKAGETLTGSGFFTARGGKGANQAVAAARLGGKVIMCGCVGNDDFGLSAIDAFVKEGIDVQNVRKVDDVPTGTAVIIVENGDNRIILDKGANACLTEQDIDKALETAKAGDIYLTQLENPIEIIGYPCWGTLGIFPNMVQSQFMAYLYGEGGLYIGCHDQNCGVKQLDFYHKDGRIKLQLRFYSGAYYGDDFSMDFDVVFRFFKGEWQDACDIYRTWYEGVADAIKIEKNPDLPNWYHESPLVVALPIRGAHDTAEMAPSRYYPYDNLLKEVERIAAKTNSKLLVLLMQWEGTAPWAPPYVWPPYGGEEAFKEFADKLHAMGHYLGLYCSGFSWTQQSKLIKEYNKEKEFEERNLKAEMCVSPEQTLSYSRVCIAQRTGYDFCPTSKVLKEIIQSEVENMFGAGVDYIQLLDQNHGGNSYFCYSKSHGHPHAPGSWQVNAMNGILEDVHQEKRLFGCESAAAEPFIKNLLFSDNRCTYAEMVGDAVPAYAYVYHSRVNNFMGNQSCCPIEYTEGDYRYRIAYSFLAGDMLTIVLDNEGDIMHYWGSARRGVAKPDQDSTFRVLEECNAWRRAAKEYLSYGDMVKPKEYVCDEHCEFTVVRRQKFAKKLPKVLANAFAYNGKRADIFINYEKEPVTVQLPISKTERVFLSSEDFTNGKWETRVNEEITIAPLSVVLIEDVQ